MYFHLPRSSLTSSLKVFIVLYRPNLVFRELCYLAHQIGREDITLSLLVLATTTNPSSTFSSPTLNNGDVSSGAGNNSLTAQYIALSSVACVGLVRRLGRSLAPALPRLVPRIFIRRYDIARPRMRAAMHKIWLALILFATPNAATAASSVASGGTSSLAYSSSAVASAPSKSSESNGKSATSSTNIATTWESGNLASISVNTLASELVSYSQIAYILNYLICTSFTHFLHYSTDFRQGKRSDGWYVGLFFFR